MGRRRPDQQPIKPGGLLLVSGKETTMVKVAVKFCGGCDPAFERVEYFERIKAAANNRIQWVWLNDGDYRMILLISGCQRACPEEEMPSSVPIVSLKTDQTDPQDVFRMLIERGVG